MDEKLILLVEDNQDDIALTLRAFRKSNLNLKVVVAEDGIEALDFIFRRGKHENRDPNEYPSLVLLDLKLPKLNGIEVLKKIREKEETKLIPVVILTSSKQEADIVMGYESGANSYIRKPVDLEKFYNVVQTLGLFWLGMNEPPNFQKDI